MTRVLRSWALAFACAFGTLPALAASGPVDDAALIARAKSEGTLALYSSVSLEDVTKIARRFELAYGIHVDVLRLESNQLPARILIEQRGGRVGADVVLTPTLQIHALNDAGFLEQRRIPEERAFVSGTFDRDGSFGGMLINTDTIVYNPIKLKAANLPIPRNWADLTRPEWRGQFAIYNHSYEWYLTMKKTLGAGPARDLMRGLAANAPHLVSSHQLALNQTADGEYVAALNAFGYDALREKRKGRPIDFVNAAPTVAEINAVGIARHAAHPNAALLFERWALSRTTQQFVVSELGRSSGRKDVRPDAATWNARMQIVISDPSNSTDYQQAAREFDEIFAPKG